MNFDNMLNRCIKSVWLTDDKEKIVFTFEDGGSRRFSVEGDCCSSSWIEHLTLPPDVAGASITGVEDGGGVPWDGHACEKEKDCGHYCLQIYNTVFHTNRGDIILEYRNDSNGYYGGYLVEAGVST